MEEELDKLLLIQLREIATMYEVPGRSGLRKSELIDLLAENVSKTKLRKEIQERQYTRQRSRSPGSPVKVPKNVIDRDLYIKIRNKVKNRVKVWPSAYASGQVVKAYKDAGGRYRGKKPSADKAPLDRWYTEKWVNVCKPKTGGGYEKCGRKQSKIKDYPYCRPSVRVNAKTPTTVGEIKSKYGKQKLEELCKKKRNQALPKGGKARRISPKETRRTKKSRR